MPRVKRSVPSRRRHKKILNLAKGFRMTHRSAESARKARLNITGRLLPFIGDGCVTVVTRT